MCVRPEYKQCLLLPFMKREGVEEIDLQGDVTIFFKAFIVCKVRKRKDKKENFVLIKFSRGEHRESHCEIIQTPLFAAVKRRMERVHCNG